MTKPIDQAKSEFYRNAFSAIAGFAYATEHGCSPFDATDLREFFTYAGLPAPASPNMWGAAFRSARACGLIRHVGVSVSGLPRRNQGTHYLWVSANAR